jgi:hypothetical protein
MYALSSDFKILGTRTGMLTTKGKLKLVNLQIFLGEGGKDLNEFTGTDVMIL